MKLLVFSDSHGMPLYMRETLEKHRDVDAVIFLGDGQNDFQMMRPVPEYRILLRARQL